MTTGQASDNISTQLPHPNEVRTEVDPNDANGITISTKNPSLKNAKSAIKQKGSRKSKHPIASQETARGEETSFKLRLRSRKHIHHGESENLCLPVETKRSRISRTEQNLPNILEDNSSTVDGQTLQEHEFGERTNESATDEDESEFGLESESDNETDFEDQDLLAETERGLLSRVSYY